MSDTTDEKDKKDPIVREVGERVDILASFEPTTLKDLGDGVFEAVVTTSETDRQLEQIKTDGITTDGWVKTGMPVLYGHDYQGLPIGKGLSFKQYKNKMTSRFQLAVKEYPFASTVADMIKGGYLNAVSIGGVVRQWSEDYMTIEAMDMVEFSVVPVPANASAVITSRSLKEVTGKSVKEIAAEYHDFVQKTTIDKVKTLPHDEINKHIESLETLLGVLKAANADTELSKTNSEVTKITLRKAAAEVTKSGEGIIKLVKKG